MDRLAVPVQGEDVRAPFLPTAAAEPPRHPGLRRRPEPRNMAFTDGLDYWDLAGDFPADGHPHWQDYSCTTTDRSAVLASAVPEPPVSPSWSRRSTPRTTSAARSPSADSCAPPASPASAGLHLAVGAAYEPPGAHLRDRGGSSLAVPGSSGWTWHEVTMPVGDAGVIRFGISLTGRGRIELRNAELSPARPGTQE